MAARLTKNTVAEAYTRSPNGIAGRSLDRRVPMSLNTAGCWLRRGIPVLCSAVLGAKKMSASSERPFRLSDVAGNLENRLEAGIFGARWMLAPAYLMLLGCIAVLTWKSVEEFFELLLNLKVFAEGRTISQVLTIVDLILMMNLVLMVLFVGYVNFISKIHPPEHREEDWPEWMEYLDYSGLKVQLLGSIIAVSSINILREVVELGANRAAPETGRFIWLAIFHSIFLLSVLVIAIVNKLKASHEKNAMG